VASLETDETAVLHELALVADAHAKGGLFVRWESAWFHQDNDGYDPGRPVEDFWQHNVWLGWRLPRRPAEFRVGVANLTGTDYRLNPLNASAVLPRGRAFVASVRLNF
jgi:hypothetical protein